MPPTSKVELYAAVRRDAREGLSGRTCESKMVIATCGHTLMLREWRAVGEDTE